MFRRLFIPAAVAALIVSACTSAATPSSTPTPTAKPTPTMPAMTMPAPTTTVAPTTSAAALSDIVATATAAGSFNTLLQAATKAGLVETLQGPGPFTVFAPTDDAFAKVPAETLQSLLANPEQLKQVLLYHVVAGKVMASDVVGLDSATSVEGSPIAVSVKDGVVYLNDSAKVVTTDIAASNGVIHVIDEVLLPPDLAPTASVAPTTSAAALSDIVATATAAGSFNTLLQAATAAGLAETLQGTGPFTVFAPTDDAFAALPKGTLDSLLADKEQLKKVLLYHVVAGKVMAADVVGLDSATTVEGSPIAITVKDGMVYLNHAAKVLMTDVTASNGVIHVIDQVLLPPEMQAASPRHNVAAE
jgi:transforming growth factor-beta-induced protein